MKPDLTDAEQREAYRTELRGLHRGWRLAGFALSLLGVILLAWPRMGGPWMLGPLPMQSWGWAALALAWMIFIGVIVARTRYHRRRMAEKPDA